MNTISKIIGDVVRKTVEVAEKEARKKRAKLKKAEAIERNKVVDSAVKFVLAKEEKRKKEDSCNKYEDIKSGGGTPNKEDSTVKEVTAKQKEEKNKNKKWDEFWTKARNKWTPI